jgi:hypothetical protein
MALSDLLRSGSAGDRARRGQQDPKAPELTGAAAALAAAGRDAA